MILDRKSVLAGCVLGLAIFGVAPSFSQQDQDSTEQKAAETPEQRSLKAFLATIKAAKAGDDLTYRGCRHRGHGSGRRSGRVSGGG